MARGLPTAFKSSIDNDDIYTYALALFIDFDVSGTSNPHEPMRINSGIKNYDIDGNTFSPSELILAIGAVGETLEINESGITISMSGIDNDLVEIARDEDFQNTTVEIDILYLDQNHDLLGNTRYFTGVIENMVYTQDREDIIVDISCASFLKQLNNPKIRRYTQADQKDIYPDDNSFLWIDLQALRDTYANMWGK